MPAAKKVTTKKAPAKKAAVKKVAAKKAPAKKAPAQKTPAKKAAAKTTGVLRGGIAALVNFSSELAAIVGDKPLTRGDMTKRLWDYIKANKLQDATNKRNINADAKLKPIFGGKTQVSMFEMTKLVNKHVK